MTNLNQSADSTNGARTPLDMVDSEIGLGLELSRKRTAARAARQRPQRAVQAQGSSSRIVDACAKRSGQFQAKKG